MEKTCGSVYNPESCKKGASPSLLMSDWEMRLFRSYSVMQ